ncbi:MAG: benzoate-CoA ligase family protein [Proteobacteria bacterium]|nr:benzoate-CoA ligase family protein [Pseudomonadota bacterium]
MSLEGNAALYFVDRHVSQGRADKVAFREAGGDERTLTYGALANRTACVAGALSRAGINREERALMLVLDKIEFPEVFWGCLKSGVIPVPLNTLLSTSVYEAILNDSRATCLFVSKELLPVVGPAIAATSHLRKIIVVGDDAPENMETYADFMKNCQPAETLDVAGDEVAFWLYSSGTTGLPKGVCHVHASLKATSDTYGQQVLNIRETDVVYSVAKIFFAYGLGNAMTFPMSVGATTILFAGRPTPAASVKIIQTEQPTIFYGVPTLYAAIIAHIENEGLTPAGNLRSCISAGEALPEDIGKSWHKLWGADILDGVGSTEMLHIFLSNSTGDVVYGTSGTAVPGYDLRLVDSDGKDIVGTGELGELLVRGASGADGYWNQRDKSRATFEGEWTRTGDKYELTEAGRYIYCGRTDDMFKVSGIWVSPFEVEQALASHPAILEAAVVAARDDKGLEKPLAYAVLKSGQDSDTLQSELKEFVKQKVGKWKYPRWIKIVPDLPKTATGKIQRFKLRSGK